MDPAQGGTHPQPGAGLHAHPHRAPFGARVHPVAAPRRLRHVFLGIQPWPDGDDHHARRPRHHAGQRTYRRLPHNLRHCGAWPHQPVSRTHRPHGCLVQVTSDCKSSGSSHNRPLTLEKPLAREEGASARHVSYACGYRHDGGRMRAQRVVDYVPVP
ncbi:hypothetical protein HMPREF9622_00602 [Cutibacterium modestum HL037PA3]|uniref:Uncharacterized protein n=1 Tax=Cutibacterium modestum HL044PA1 TaxID=765109 RepID=A0ABN0C9A7_9ACTN|nr:hypothetical protein HMPREF9621_01107 [Cutibacterium modestum HL037PA2]EFS93703.1 hypothetical protein HMPREF9607_00158 [Cutibacterium modestum HL044PA1]EFT16396.1 hypothetical protein HMPREF9622_00602 [Cutibacterium modestum HL037PA3]